MNYGLYYERETTVWLRGSVKKAKDDTGAFREYEGAFPKALDYVSRLLD